MDICAFKVAIKFLLKNNFISKGSQISLYDWGEPFLHPELGEILNFLNQERFIVRPSTSASRASRFDYNFHLSHVISLVFSMSGFSQSSYDKIHGFSFEKIKANMATIVKDFKVNFPYLIMFISLTLTRYRFAKSLGVKFVPYLAYMMTLKKWKNF